jgi:hypothetical protein
MGLLDSVFGKSKVNAANKKVKAAREANDPVALEKALTSAITIYQSIGSDSSVFKDALYNWGMALLYSARLKKQDAEAIVLYEEAGCFRLGGCSNGVGRFTKRCYSGSELCFGKRKVYPCQQYSEGRCFL